LQNLERIGHRHCHTRSKSATVTAKQGGSATVDASRAAPRRAAPS
jgi:hypothetical protein